MRFTLILTLISLWLPLSVWARETDNYLAWGVDLTDARTELNGYISEQIQIVLDKQSRGSSCEEVTFAIADRFKTGIRYESRFEKWARRQLTAEQIYPKGKVDSNTTIHRDPFYFYMNFAEPAPLLQVNGYYFGTDKLSHFGSIARVYLKKYLRAREEGMSVEQAEERAIQSGLKLEKTILGLLGSGVFSYADLEANYQGFLFLRSMCLDSKKNYLARTSEGNWKLDYSPDVGDYVNAYWDESFYQSYFLKPHWAGVARVLKEKYCSKRQDPRVQARFAFYESDSSKSFSVRYLARLREEKSPSTPSDARQDFSAVCDSTSSI
jgi:hypothetical protein